MSILPFVYYTLCYVRKLFFHQMSCTRLSHIRVFGDLKSTKPIPNEQHLLSGIKTPERGMFIGIWWCMLRKHEVPWWKSHINIFSPVKLAQVWRNVKLHSTLDKGHHHNTSKCNEEFHTFRMTKMSFNFVIVFPSRRMFWAKRCFQ